MKPRNRYSCGILLSSLLVTAPAPGDDTEIFFSTDVLADTESFQPNVLFIFDTSGSMGDTITTQDAYDPSYDYGGVGSDTVYVYDTDYDYRNISIAPSRNSCDAMTDYLDSNTDTPVYIGKVAEWYEDNSFFCTWIGWCRDRWRDPTSSSNTIECQDDAGIHGIDDSSTDLYAADGSSGPYQSSASGAIPWNQNGITNRLYVSANYHWYLQTAATVSRVKIDVMQEAATDLVNEFSGLNFGLMRFDGSNGGYVLHHFSDIEDDRSNIISSINALTASGNTPLSETLWEAHKYFSGGSVEYGTNSNRDPLAVTSGQYNSPVGGNDSSCQSNYVVYLTDGNPYSDSGRDSTISNLTSSCSHQDGTSSSDHTCLDELAGYMASYDYNDDIDETQSVNTYTIGFDIDMELLEETARQGGGDYYTVSTSEELKAAFNKIILDILSNSTTFSAPAVSVNAFNRLQHQDELYFATFQPNIYPRWYGNIKKYKLNTDGDIIGSDDAVAVDPNTGYFKANAISYWSATTDGDAVKEGGAANELTNSRTIYSVSGNPATSDVALNDSDNIVTLDNDLFTNEMYGLVASTPDAQRQELINWILGVDVEDDNDNNNTTDASHFMADALHGRPVVVTYEADSLAGSRSDILFFTSNDGAFHAIDTSDGSELFAFIPQDQLPNQLAYFANDADSDRVYGLDGPLTLWQEENPDDDDVDIDAADGDYVYGFYGMRRGGNNYYAMDLTSLDAPKLKWTIFGGNAGFQDLGETWSKPVRSSVKWDCDSDGENCTTKKVLFFGGGYDPVHDTATSPTTQDNGAAIYMVDADSGVLLWSAGNNSDNVAGDDTHDLDLPMENSIPGDVTVADMNGDGYDDILFAVDILGHVWRIDINKETTSASDFAWGGEIADLTEAGQFRRFYVGPTVSLSKKLGQTPFFVLTFGSGYLAHPKDTDISDRLYALFEYDVYTPPEDTDDDDIPDYSSVGNDDLLDLTDSADGPANQASNAPHGFYKDATANGEKFLRSPLTIDGVTIYTSYLPEGSDAVATTCGAGYLGGSRLYAMDFVTGETVLTGQYIDLKQPGIAPEVVALFVPDADGNTQVKFYAGTELIDEEGLPDSTELYRTYWRENRP